MKKALAILLALSLTAALAACGKQDESSDKSDAATTTTAAANQQESSGEDQTTTATTTAATDYTQDSKVSCTFLISSCGTNRQHTESEYITPSQKAENDLEKILKSINEHDSESIKVLLSETVRDSIDVDSEINQMFEFFDGDIVSYDNPFGSATGSSEKKDAGAKVQSLKTDKGTEYYIAIKEWYSYDEHPEQVGIYNITVKNTSILSSELESDNAVYRLNADK